MGGAPGRASNFSPGGGVFFRVNLFASLSWIECGAAAVLGVAALAIAVVGLLGFCVWLAGGSGPAQR